ncbi:MAG: bifunctional 23S rRNA (guanine(2069)-N(7))-methyltransferase RlmK/23S rRNA (guanine(2445)-N(2))-methyltransferase RlmL [Lysobacterales bacterium]
MSIRRWFAACPKGIELLLADELRGLGATEAREALAGVHCQGDIAFAYRTLLWSRLASRLLMPLAEFDVPTEQDLYDGVRAIDWREHLGPEKTFAVAVHGTTRALNNSMFAALRVKDAIVDRLRAEGLSRPNVDADTPDLRIDLVLRHERAILSLDLAGAPLHQRGYRRGTGAAPLKENLAAAMLVRAGWPAIAEAGGALVDPMCGSGTLLIEGARIAADVAPGLGRERFGVHGWAQFDAALWSELRAEARARADAGLRASTARFFGADSEAAVLGAAKANAQAAGVAGFLNLAHRDVDALRAPTGFDCGLVISNPPYGERLAHAQLEDTYARLGARLREGFAQWPVALLVADENLGRATGLKLKRRYKLFNGALPVELLLLDATPREAREPAAPRELSAGELFLVNRLNKNEKHLRAWRKREGITCWRVYDAELPEYAAAIDVYQTDQAFTWLVVQEYAPPPEIPVATAQRRLRETVHAAAQALVVPRAQVVVKQRRQQTPLQRYARHEHGGQTHVVVENGLNFEVNLRDYLDTGLFLDHRPMRVRVRDAAAGKRVLNLFCYTGAATVYAAAGGARSTVSVDLSATYLEWAWRNFELNGIVGEKHRLVQADALLWLAGEREQFDLIFVDPPSFSNSARADDFEVQRDHPELLRRCARVLAPDGLILFSCNFRRFRLDPELAREFHVRDITRSTIPPDFARDQRIHHAFELRSL